MSKPAIIPETTTAGIAVDPRTLERVIPESRRPDGSVRKEKKIRPGFTPQEDVRRFRGTRQAQMDTTALPKGHIIGWTPPSGAAKPATKPGAAPGAGASAASLSKSAKKNEKRKEKRKAAVTTEKVKDSWEDEDEEPEGENAANPEAAVTAKAKEGTASAGDKTGDGTEGLAEKLEKLEVH